MVDLPEPEVPTNAIFYPEFNEKLRSFKTTLSLEGYLKKTFLNCMLPFIYPVLIFFSIKNC